MSYVQISYMVQCESTLIFMMYSCAVSIIETYIRTPVFTTKSAGVHI